MRGCGSLSWHGGGGRGGRPSAGGEATQAGGWQREGREGESGECAVESSSASAGEKGVKYTTAEMRYCLDSQRASPGQPYRHCGGGGQEVMSHFLHGQTATASSGRWESEPETPTAPPALETPTMAIIERRVLGVSEVDVG